MQLSRYNKPVACWARAGRAEGRFFSTFTLIPRQDSAGVNVAVRALDFKKRWGVPVRMGTPVGVLPRRPTANKKSQQPPPVNRLTHYKWMQQI